MRKPVIGITSSMSERFIRMNEAYFKAIYAAGGLPVFLPFTGGADAARQYVESGDFDGILFAGGVDVDPKHYGEEITGEDVEIIEERDCFELAVAELIKDTDIPILGICRGVQLMNVVWGGNLHQHIPHHKQEEPGKEHNSPVTVIEGTLLRELVDCEEMGVNSFHHQAVKDVAPGYVASAVSVADGIIEAIEPKDRKGRFILGVQWHPELFFADDVRSSAIFEAFVAAASENMKNKAEKQNGK